MELKHNNAQAVIKEVHHGSCAVVEEEVGCGKSTWLDRAGGTLGLDMSHRGSRNCVHPSTVPRSNNLHARSLEKATCNLVIDFASANTKDFQAADVLLLTFNCSNLQCTAIAFGISVLHAYLILSMQASCTHYSCIAKKRWMNSGC